jgi:hypothetical protein
MPHLLGYHTSIFSHEQAAFLKHPLNTIAPKGAPPSIKAGQADIQIKRFSEDIEI